MNAPDPPDTPQPAPTLPVSGFEAAGAAPAVPGYEVLGELGRGGMGVVYKARQVALDRVVALKVILHADCAGAEARDRFRAEARAAARLQHPNAVHVYEVGEYRGLPYFAQEYCPGGSLAARLDGTPRPPGEAAGLVEALARAADAAHRAGVVHRDIKPGNVLLAAGGEPKLADFGLAKLIGADGPTRTGAVLGTPAYMAPEQADGRVKEIGPATDVYALGVLLYELLAGRPPFKAPSAAETLAQVIAADPPPVQPACPRDLEAIVRKCLEKDPARRYASAAELADDLRRFREGRPVVPRPAGPVARLWQWVRRNPVTAAAAGLGLLALALAAVVPWAGSSRQPDPAAGGGPPGPGGGLVFATQVGPDGRAIDPGTSFPAGVRTLYAVFRPDAVPPGLRVNADAPAPDARYAFLKVKGDSSLSSFGWRWVRGGRVVNAYETKVGPGAEVWLQRFSGGDRGLFEGESGPGTYTVEILLGGNPAVRADLTITP
jgi:hypothetical protein